MNATELKKKYLSYFKNKDHAILPSASLVPENDPTTLFTGSGMQPMLPYLLGQKHPLGIRIADSQKCFRSQDIEEVGDNRHTTFFEMLGNWSFGDYFKKEQLRWFFEFLTQSVGLDPKHLYVSVFRGNEKIGILRDDESVAIWQSLFESRGISAQAVDNAEENGMQDGRIFYYAAVKNWWSRASSPETMPVGEPGGPDSEVFYDFGQELKIHEKSVYKNQQCHINCDCGRFLEIGNSVFMEYVKTANGFEKLPQKNVDFGGGFERILAAENRTQDIFATDLFAPIVKKVEEISGKIYTENEEIKKPFRVIADHMRAATMLASDGVYPSNKDQGYFSRRLLRRAIRYGKTLGIERPFLHEVVPVVAEIYKETYPEVMQSQADIIRIFAEEENRFRKTLDKGLEKLAMGGLIFGSGSIVTIEVIGKEIFDLYQTNGFPPEMSVEELKKKNTNLDIPAIMVVFEQEKKKHQELSRIGAAQKFTGGLVDQTEDTTKLHTATHLLQSALRRVLGTHVTQAGSNITAERLRFDFSHPEKLSEEQIKKVEDLVNEIIKRKLPVTMEVMSLPEAQQKGAMALFGQKYGEKVKVYSIGDFSIEVCGGPHVENTGELGRFRIQKQENIGKGVRRIKAVLE